MIDIKKHLRDDVVVTPHWKIVKDTQVFIEEILSDYLKDNPNPSFFDVGGGVGSKAKWAPGYDYYIMDIIPRPKSPKNIVVGDISDCSHIPDNTYDVVFSYMVYEHLKEPWKASTESMRILKPNGLIICIAPFSWRYHPVPIDTFKYSHTAMQILFGQDKNVQTIFAGYDISIRRQDVKGYWENGLDKAPLDQMGGFRENISTVYVGRKVEEELVEELDSDFTVEH